MIEEEYRLYDFGSVVAAVGGNLGLFVGLSLLNLVEALTRKLCLLLKQTGLK